MAKEYKDLLSMVNDLEKIFTGLKEKPNQVKADDRLNFNDAIIKEIDKTVIKVYLPGIKKEEIKVNIKDNLLNISVSGNIYKQFKINNSIDRSKIVPKLDLGILVINLFTKEDVTEEEINIE